MHNGLLALRKLCKKYEYKVRSLIDFYMEKWVVGVGIACFGGVYIGVICLPTRTTHNHRPVDHTQPQHQPTPTSTPTHKNAPAEARPRALRRGDRRRLPHALPDHDLAAGGRQVRFLEWMCW